MVCVIRISKNLLSHIEYVLQFVRRNHACVLFVFFPLHGMKWWEVLNSVTILEWWINVFPTSVSSLSSYAVIAYGCASCPKLTCEREGCQTEFCYHCKQIWHPNQTCDMARQQRAQTLRVRTKHTSGLSYGQESGPGISWYRLIVSLFAIL